MPINPMSCSAAAHGVDGRNHASSPAAVQLLGRMHGNREQGITALAAYGYAASAMMKESTLNPPWLPVRLRGGYMVHAVLWLRAMRYYG